MDVNNDGLLDVYFSTYAASMIGIRLAKMDSRGSRLRNLFGGTDGVLPEFLSPDQDSELLERAKSKSSQRISQRVGPPNVLFVNQGDGRLELAEAPALEGWRNTFQTTWADYDDDGDVDAYLANDFGFNNLVRNEGGLSFTDITEESGTADLGFGMGASWGDYDEDGRQDLYVTNMYSKAGRRIARLAGELAADGAPMARGNTLFRSTSESFERVSGLEPPALLVEKGGWGWAGQFVDVDNDCDLDIFSLSGYYSAPDQVAIPEDT
jgi:hypothetical protein